jgi:hypothetical protein
MLTRLRSLWSNRRFIPPPLIFVTHAKAGSTWVDHILRGIYRKLVAPRLYEKPARYAFEKHRIYSAIFMSRDEFLQHPELFGIHRFVVIRDLRDTLVSQYFSWRDNHQEDPSGSIAARRKMLLSMNEEEGLIYMIENVLQKHAGIQKSWISSDAPVLRYEELIERDVELFCDLLLNRFGHPIGSEQVERVVKANRFESVFGRKLGVEDAKSHGRSGAPGAWHRHFTPAVCVRFQEKFGDVLTMTGYEKDDRWTQAAVAQSGC